MFFENRIQYYVNYYIMMWLNIYLAFRGEEVVEFIVEIYQIQILIVKLVIKELGQ